MDFDHPRPKQKIFEPIKVIYDFFQNLTQHHVQHLTLSHKLKKQISLDGLTNSAWSELGTAKAQPQNRTELHQFSQYQGEHEST